MGKRQKITYNGEELTHNLKQSTGKGVDAFFPDSFPAPANNGVTTVELPASHEPDAGANANTHARVGARMYADVSAPKHANVDALTNAHGDEHAHPGTDSDMLVQAETSDDSSVDEPADANVDTRIGARTHAPTDEDRSAGDASISSVVEEVNIDAIQKAIRAKRHLSSFTFRFRANELEELDLAVDELNQNDEHRVSKNDAVRTALNWLLADYKAHKRASVLARVLMDT